MGIPFVIRQVNPRSVVHTPNLRELFLPKKTAFWKILTDEKNGQTAEIGLDGDPQGETLTFLHVSQI